MTSVGTASPGIPGHPWISPGILVHPGASPGILGYPGVSWGPRACRVSSGRFGGQGCSWSGQRLGRGLSAALMLREHVPAQPCGVFGSGTPGSHIPLCPGRSLPQSGAGEGVRPGHLL